MSLSTSDRPTLEAADRLGPFARVLLDRAAAHARRLHAEEVALTHYLYVMLVDEDTAAARLVLGAFADPETIAKELLALSPGILVVGSGRSLPFSPGAVLALDAARATAVAERATTITPFRLARAAHEALAPEHRASLGDAPALEPEPDGAALAEDVTVLAALSADARRALGAACRRAAQRRRDAIAPAHLYLGALDVVDGAAPRRERLELALARFEDDPTPLPDRSLALDPEFAAFVRALPAGAGTVDVLRGVLGASGGELPLLFVQERVTPTLVERVGAAYEDPRPV